MTRFIHHRFALGAFKFARAIFLLLAVISLGFSMLAFVDVTAQLGLGYSWEAILASIIGSLAMIFGWWLVGRMSALAARLTNKPE